MARRMTSGRVAQLPHASMAALNHAAGRATDRLPQGSDSVTDEPRAWWESRLFHLRSHHRTQSTRTCRRCADGRSGFRRAAGGDAQVAALFPGQHRTIPGRATSRPSGRNARVTSDSRFRDTGRLPCLRQRTGGCLSGGGSVSLFASQARRCGGGPERKQPDRSSGAKGRNGRLGGRDRRSAAQLVFRRWCGATTRYVSHRLRRLMDRNIERLRLRARRRREWECHSGSGSLFRR